MPEQLRCSTLASTAHYPSANPSRALALPYIRNETRYLADGAISSAPVFAANVHFADEWRQVPIHGMGDVALVGMQLLWAARFTVDVVIDGPVSLEFFGNRRFRLAPPRADGAVRG